MFRSMIVTTSTIPALVMHVLKFADRQRTQRLCYVPKRLVPIYLRLHLILIKESTIIDKVLTYEGHHSDKTATCGVPRIRYE